MNEETKISRETFQLPHRPPFKEDELAGGNETKPISQVRETAKRTSATRVQALETNVSFSTRERKL
jgi:hypothetical protein